MLLHVGQQRAMAAATGLVTAATCHPPCTLQHYSSFKWTQQQLQEEAYEQPMSAISSQHSMVQATCMLIPALRQLAAAMILHQRRCPA